MTNRIVFNLLFSFAVGLHLVHTVLLGNVMWWIHFPFTSQLMNQDKTIRKRIENK